RVPEALVVSVVDDRRDGGEDAPAHEPVDLLDVVFGVRPAGDARRRVQVDDPDDGERGDRDEQQPVEVLARAPEQAAAVVEAEGHGRGPGLPGGDLAEGARPARIARRGSDSWMICIATGTATSGPEPPCSTRTVTAISGLCAGAKLENHAWFCERNQPILASSSFFTTYPVCAVPVFPATSSVGSRAGYAVPLGSLTTSKRASVMRRRLSGATGTCRRMRGGNSWTTAPSLVSTARTTCGWKSVPPFASAAYALASCSGVTVTSPSPMAMLSVKPTRNCPRYRSAYHERVGMRPGASGLMPRPVLSPRPKACATRAIRSMPTVSARWKKYTLHDRAMASCRRTLPCTWLQRKTRRPKTTYPSHFSVWSGSMTWSSSPASALKGFIVEPGWKAPLIVLSSIGRSGSAYIRLYASRTRARPAPPERSLGSKSGFE